MIWERSHPSQLSPELTWNDFKKMISSQLYFSIGVILPELLMSGCCYFSVSDMGKNPTQRELSPWQN